MQGNDSLVFSVDAGSHLITFILEEPISSVQGVYPGSPSQRLIVAQTNSSPLIQRNEIVFYILKHFVCEVLF